MNAWESRHFYFSIITSFLLLWVLIACQKNYPSPIHSNQSQETGHVALLVVDDFTANKPLTYTPSSATSDDSRCMFTPNGQQRFGHRKLSPNPNNISHGKLVLSVIEEVLQHGDAGSRDEISTLVNEGKPLTATRLITVTGQQVFQKYWISELQVWNTPEGKLLLAAIDISDASTLSLTIRLREAIQAIESAEPMTIGTTDLGPLKGFVFNMSFAFFPCSFTLTDTTQSVLAETLLTDYLQVLKPNWEGILNGEVVDEADNSIKLGNVACSLISDQGVQSLCNSVRTNSDQPLTQKPHVTIAAAGNLGLPFPLAPALFSGIVSVSAADGIGDISQLNFDQPFSPFGFSNWGEIKMNGIHPTNKVMGSDSTLIADEGTSYAAPRVSLQTALYLLKTANDQCGDEPVLSFRIFKNSTIKDATKDCPDFLNTQ